MIRGLELFFSLSSESRYKKLQHSSDHVLQSYRLALAGARRHWDGTAAVAALRYLQVKRTVRIPVGSPLVSESPIVRCSVCVHLRGNRKSEMTAAAQKEARFLHLQQELHGIRSN